VGVLRALGPARSRRAGGLHDGGPLDRVVPLHELSRDRRRRRARARAARHLRRRAGLELYCATEFGAALWRTLWGAGEDHGLAAGGYRAIDSLRLEKGYRVWGADITPDEHPFQAGLGFAVKPGKGEFIGREALLRVREETGGARLCCLVLDDPRSVALSNEPVAIDGQVLGRVTSGGYGYTVGASIAYAYLPAEHAVADTEVAVEIFGEWVAGRVAREPLYDPEGARVRA